MEVSGLPAMHLQASVPASWREGRTRLVLSPAGHLLLMFAGILISTFPRPLLHQQPFVIPARSAVTSSSDSTGQQPRVSTELEGAAARDTPAGRTSQGRLRKTRSDSPPVRCAQNLRDAVNGAISEISGTRVLVEHLLRLWSAVPYVPMLVCPSSLFPYAPTLPWPKKERLQRGDLLRDVLSAGTLRVAGVGSTAVSLGPMTIVAAQNRGEEGNYSSPEPTGFFPQYMRMIAGIIGSHYGSTVTVQWLFYPSVEEAQQAVLRGQAHMTDIYFLLGQSTPGEPQPLMDFYATCPVVGSPALLILREDQVAENPGAPGMPAKQPATNSASSLDKHALLNLNRRIDNTSDERERKVVFVSRDLANTVQHSLSPKALLHFAADLDSAISMVRDGHAAAVFTTGVVPPLSPPMTVVNAHLLLAKGAWIERTHALECMEEEHENGLTAYAQEKASEGTSKLESAHAPEAISSVTLSLIFGGVIAVSSAVAF